MRRNTVMVTPPAPAYADIGPFEAVVEHHPWLHCWRCGERVHHGTSANGAPLFACMRCKVVCDGRRVP